MAITIGTMGLLLSLVHGLHIGIHDKSPLATFVGAVLPLTLSLLLVYAGYWTSQIDVELAYLVRLAGWTALGGIAMGSLMGTITAHQYLAGHLSEDALFQLTTAVTGGTLGGFLVGLYDVQTRRRADRIEALQHATSEFVEATTKTAVCDLTVRLIAAELNMPLAGAWLYNETEDRLEPVAATEEGEATFDEHPVFESGEGLSWDVFVEGEPQIFADLQDHPARYNSETILRSEMILPLGDHGVLNIGSREPDAFDNVDVSTVLLLTSVASAVLDRAAREEELRVQRRELETQNERLEEFASIVSHDLRNPLAVANGHLELAMEDCDSPALSEVETAHERMETLITDVLQLARSGQTIETKTRVSLATAVTNAWQMVDSADATLTLEDDELVLTADESRLRQLLENLFRNAVEHGGPSVTIRVGVLADRRGLFVEDTGPGIPPEDRERVFESGFTSNQEGTGLGLATVQRIADAHGWTVSVTEGRHGGARFEVCFRS